MAATRTRTQTSTKPRIHFIRCTLFEAFNAVKLYDEDMWTRIVSPGVDERLLTHFWFYGLDPGKSVEDSTARLSEMAIEIDWDKHTLLLASAPEIDTRDPASAKHFNDRDAHRFILTTAINFDAQIEAHGWDRGWGVTVSSALSQQVRDATWKRFNLVPINHDFSKGVSIEKREAEAPGLPEIKFGYKFVKSVQNT